MPFSIYKLLLHSSPKQHYHFKHLSSLTAPCWFLQISANICHHRCLQEYFSPAITCLDALSWCKLFSFSNGTCSSQTEAKHVPVVKKTWCCSSHNEPLPQILQTITCLDKFTALQHVFEQYDLLAGTIINYMAQQSSGNPPSVLPWIGPSADASNYGQDYGSGGNNDNHDDNAAPVPSPKTDTVIWLAAKHRKP